MSQHKKPIVQSALVSLITLSVMGASHTLQAADKAEDYIKCYGVAAAGKNDCGTAIAACSATVNVDDACYAWIYVPKGICVKLAHSSVGKPAAGCKEPKPKNKPKDK